MNWRLKGWPIPDHHKARLSLAVLSGWPKCEDCEAYFEPYATERAVKEGDSPETCHRCWHLFLRDGWNAGGTGPGDFDCETCQRNIGRRELRGRRHRNL